MKILKSREFEPSISLYKKIIDIEFTNKNNKQLKNWIYDNFVYEYKEYLKETNKSKNIYCWWLGFVCLTILNIITPNTLVYIVISTGLWIGYINLLSNYLPYKDKHFKSKDLLDKFLKIIKKENPEISFELIKKLQKI